MTTVDLTWDVSTYFPGLESREFQAADEQLGASIDRLTALYDRHDVRRGDKAVDDDTGPIVDEIVEATNAVLAEVDVLEAYVYAFVSTDASNDLAQGILSRIEQRLSKLQNLQSRLDAWLASLGADAVIAVSEQAQSHAWPVRKSAQRAACQMSEAEEELASAMSLTGASAWSRLYADVTSAITAEVELPDGPASLPITAIRGLATDANAEVRTAAYWTELEAWETHRIPIAAALNAIKGEQRVLIERRGWPSVLDAQLFGQAVDRVTLDAMQAAVVGSFGDFRRYFRAKARLLGHDGGLPFHDLFAPVGDTRLRTWEEAKASVEEAFASYSPQLQNLARRSYEERWIDVDPRPGKRGGAFCMPMGDGDSRVMLNFNGSFDGFMTLAHELGHAYHNSTMTERTPMQRGTPSSLAETASIFCETIMVNHGLATADDAERLVLLDADLLGSAQVVVDIHSRFLFESAVFEKRAASTLSPEQFCELMADAQEQTYGDGLHPELRHPWMWAAKPHYYGSLFYNWPYTFGLLFGIGLFARYREDPDRFRSSYDDLLSSTGLGRADELAARFDIDITDEAFWQASLDVIRGRIDDFCTLVAAAPEGI